MSILGTVSNEVKQTGKRIVIAGPEKVGKTTLGCQAPGALLVPLEIGSGNILVPKTRQLTTWEEIETLCLELIAAAKAGQIRRGSSIVWDSGTALERAMHDYTIRTDKYWKPGNPNSVTMESAHDGYGKGYNIANGLFERWTRYMDELAEYGGINCIIPCHVFADHIVDPAHGEYDTWNLLLHSPKNLKTYGKREFITQWADLVGFLHEPISVMKTDKNAILTKGISNGQGRVLAVDRSPSWVAGNRFKMTGLIPIPEVGGWNYLADAIYKACGIDLYNREL